MKKSTSEEWVPRKRRGPSKITRRKARNLACAIAWQAIRLAIDQGWHAAVLAGEYSPADLSRVSEAMQVLALKMRERMGDVFVRPMEGVGVVRGADEVISPRDVKRWRKVTGDAPVGVPRIHLAGRKRRCRGGDQGSGGAVQGVPDEGGGQGRVVPEVPPRAQVQGQRLRGDD